MPDVLPKPRTRNPKKLILTIIGLLLVSCGESATVGVYVTVSEGGVPWLIGTPSGIPVWSPVAAEIAWGGENGLTIADVEARSQRLISTQTVAGHPAWAPDGSAIAFVDRVEQTLTVLDLATGKPRFAAPIANPDFRNGSHPLLTLGGPAWSPDGTQLAFPCWDGGGEEICTIASDGDDRRQLTQIEADPTGNSASDGLVDRANSGTGPPAWSPDGRSIAVAVYPERRGAPAGVYVIDLDRGRSRKVSSLQPNWEIAWFPDSTALLCAATRDGRSDVYRIDVTSGETENLTADLPAGARYPALDPSGSLLAVATRGEIVTVNMDDKSRHHVESPAAAKYPTWSSDGSKIAFSSDLDPIRWYE